MLSLVIALTAMKIIVDTNIFISALMSESGAAREILRRCFKGIYQPCLSLPLFAEYRDLLGRADLFVDCALSASEREELLQAFFHVCELVEIYYLWRPNLRDEGDNHVLELAIAAGSNYLVTYNIKDFRHAQLRFPALKILTPCQLLQGGA